VTTLKIISLVIGLSVLVVLAILGFAIWVFIPLLPAAILLVIALMAGKQKPTITDKSTEAKPEDRKAA
jgi:Na+/pantothenate symporter